jgi:hypothetical protein
MPLKGYKQSFEIRLCVDELKEVNRSEEGLPDFSWIFIPKPEKCTK